MTDERRFLPDVDEVRRFLAFRPRPERRRNRVHPEHRAFIDEWRAARQELERARLEAGEWR